MDRLSTKGQMIDQIDLRSVAHSGFDRSNHNYGTGKMGAIIPTRLDEVYPGDRIKGKPEVVVNFEPLAAPLMGSMVLKQESFFVPYIQVWRHAYKFFTGKNGFSELFPSVSPQEIFQVYTENVHYGWSDAILPLLNELHEFKQANFADNFREYSDGVSLINELKSTLISATDNKITATYEGRKMLDLVQPARDILTRFIESEELKIWSDNFDSPDGNTDMYLREFLYALADVCMSWVNFFHGPSSLFDYLGWPTPTDWEYDALYVGDSDADNIFKAYIISHVLLDNEGHYAPIAWSSIKANYFSAVPLNFAPFKAYYLIWYWNYRDQLLETGILDPEEDEFLGSSITTNVILYTTIMRQRCWFKDTFTTALTNTGSGNLLVPTDTLESDSVEYSFYDPENSLIDTKDAATALASGATVCKVNNHGITYSIPMQYLNGAFTSPAGSLVQDVSSGYVSLELFDRIKRLRSYIQKRLILGYEVDDVIFSSFMVRVSNTRIHIPEILGRGRDSVQINTVVNNTSTAQQIAGDKTATAWAHGQQSDMDYFSEEWGLYLSFMTIMPIQSYAGGMQRLYLKRDPLDFAWPEFATLGFDAVYNTELAALGTRLTDAQGLAVFGYQGRYYDLKSRQDEEHGRLLTDLNYLTFSREWDKNNPPKLNYVFVHCWPRLDGFVLDDPSQDVFRYDCYNAQGWERRFPVPSEIIG